MLTLRFGAELGARARLREGGADGGGAAGGARSPGGEAGTERTWRKAPRGAGGGGEGGVRAPAARAGPGSPLASRTPPRAPCAPGGGQGLCSTASPLLPGQRLQDPGGSVAGTHPELIGLA